MTAMRERACTAHKDEPAEAEYEWQGTLLYVVLRCPVCDRPSGMRLVRKPRVTS